MLYIARSCHFKNCLKKIQPKGGNLWQKVMTNYKHFANNKVVALEAVSKIGFQMFFTDSKMMCFHSLLI